MYCHLFSAKDKKIILTSNRDRSLIVLPKKFIPKNGVFYPKDAAKKDLVYRFRKWKCYYFLLNGAFENHKKKLNIEKVIGLIVLDLILRKTYLQPYKILIYKILNLLL